MSKIKETITALAAGDYPGAVHISRRENEPITDERLMLILKCVIRVASIAAGTVLALNAGIEKLALIFFFVILFSLFYYGLKD